MYLKEVSLFEIFNSICLFIVSFGVAAGDAQGLLILHSETPSEVRRTLCDAGD